MPKLEITNSAFADGLRKLADWFEAHPEIKVPSKVRDYGHLEIDMWDMKTADVPAFVTAVPKSSATKPTPTDLFQEYNVMFGILPVRFSLYRPNTCERVKVGTSVTPEKFVPEHIEPEQMLDIYEFRCPEIE